MVSITETYIKHAQSSPEKIAIQTNNIKISYRAWHEMVSKTANWLDSLTIARPSIGIFLPNGVPFLQLFAGAATAGWTTVLFDLKWTETELQQRLILSQPSILITTRELFPKIQHLPVEFLIWDDILPEINQAPLIRDGAVDGKTPFYMGFTSGSTGSPKAFIRSHDSWVESFECSRVDFQLNENDHVVVPGALIHSHFLYGAISTLYLGGTVYLLEKFSSKTTLLLMEAQPITAVYVVPTMIAAFLKEEWTIEKKIKIISSGAKWEEQSKDSIRQMFPCLTMFEFYGASELSFVTVLKENDRKPGSVGKPCHNVQIQIRRSNKELAEPNEAGKIFVKSNMLFIGYLYHDESNWHQRIQSITDENGWITVDDMGYIDVDGYLYISGREKNMILYGAINIFPEEIETVIGEHPEVDEVAVIGIQDPYWGQVVAAVVKGSAAIIELKKLCKQHLSSYKIPRKWFYTEEMPHTTSGKIARQKVKELIESKVMNH